MTIISDLGEGITITKVTSVASGDYSEITETTSTVATTAIVVFLTTNDESVKAGIMQTGDARGYFAPSDTTNLAEGHRITYNSKDYEIVGEPRPYTIGGTAIHTEVDLKRLYK